MTSRKSILSALVVLAGLVIAAPGRAAPPTLFTVNSNADAPDDTLDGVCATAGHVCTLRAAVTEANAVSGATINFSMPGSVTYLLTMGTLTMSSNTSIVGNGAAFTIIDGDGSVTFSRVFALSSSSIIVSMSGLTIQNGWSNQGGGIYNAAKLSLANSVVVGNAANVGSPNVGGRIYNTGLLTITNGLINNNSAPNVTFSGGGGISNARGTVTLINSTVDGNSTDNAGGGIHDDSGLVSLINSTVGNNTAKNGGGIFNGGLGSGTLNIMQSGIYSNTSTSTESRGGGGGIENFMGVATLINSTIYFNFANGNGGGLLNDVGGTSSLYNVTVACNYADVNNNNVGVGGGIANSNSGAVNFRNTLIGKNWSINGCISCNAPDDCAGTLNSEDYNLIQTTSGCTILGAVVHNKTGMDPLLDVFVHDNGGPTLTEALLQGSPAIDAGNTGGCRDGLGALVATDQRGSVRPYPPRGRCDIGAYERVVPLYLPLIVK
jgi:hypothetical protein